MKKVRITFVTVVLLLALFANTAYATFAGIYDDQYWTKGNEIRMLYGIGLYIYKPEEQSDKINYTETDEQLELYSSINSNVISFFADTYGLNVEEKISEMTVSYFSYDDPVDFLAGYTVRNSGGINLNIALMTTPDYEPFLSSSYLHEVMHFLGVSSTVLSPLDEGFAEYLAIKCSDYAGMEYYPTMSYSYCLSVAAEMSVVNEQNIVKSYLTDDNFDIAVHITETLKDVPQLYNQVEDIGSVFSTLVGNLGTSYDDTAYVLAFMAQDVANAYCKEFNPTKDQIDIIRSHYFVPEVETVKITVSEDGFELS